MGTDESNTTGEMKETMEKELPNQQHRNKVHYEKKLTKNIRPTDILLVFSKCSQIY